MRSRLGFAIARHLTPEVLLIDEVLGVGDNQFRQKAVDTMHRMINSQQTVVIVSHSAGELARLCDRLVWIEGGRVAAIGEPRDILRQYHGGAPASGSSAPRA
jgi:lipopolysaccharide transport system ATP-binding protein